jgi:hypothetical protein
MTICDKVTQHHLIESIRRWFFRPASYGSRNRSSVPVATAARSIHYPARACLVAAVFAVLSAPRDATRDKLTQVFMRRGVPSACCQDVRE